MLSDEITRDEWPFQEWLRHANRTFGLSPEVFWKMGVRDWRTLSVQDNKPSMTRTDLEVLLQKFPDRKIDND